MHVRKLPLQHYVNRVNADVPFTFIRYGDGEWSAILNDRRSRTGSGSHTLKMPAMQKLLRQSIKNAPRDRDYVMALRETAVKPTISQWIVNHANDILWHDCTILYKASKKGRLYPFIQAIRDSKLPKVIVGPPWLRNLNGPIFKVSALIETPSRDCWRERGRILRETLAFGKPAIIMISAGPPAKVFAWQLQKKLPNSFIIDVGSLWDVYAGKRSRQYMKNMNVDTMRRNLHGK